MPRSWYKPINRVNRFTRLKHPKRVDRFLKSHNKTMDKRPLNKKLSQHPFDNLHQPTLQHNTPIIQPILSKSKPNHPNPNQSKLVTWIAQPKGINDIEG
jgi:hypothetical protein